MYYKEDLGYVYPKRSDEHMLVVKHLRDTHFDEKYPYYDKSFKAKLRRFSFFLLYNLIVWPVCKLAHGVKVYGKKNYKKHKRLIKNGAITIANHVFMWDFLCVLSVVRPHLLHFPAWKTNFEGPNAFFIRLVGGIPIPTKNLRAMAKFQKAIDEGFSRNDLFVGIGGGVICDITAFAASIFKRGAAVQFVPTTLLSMVDAAVGGKSGCDFENYKNMIGTFFPAQKIYYFTEFIQYLPENQYYSGLAEALKTGILFNETLFEYFEKESEKIKARDSKILKEIITLSVKEKANVVEKDFTEKNIRAYLNLGHTFAHAYESIMGLGAITHGEAVAWGIGRAITYSFKKEYCREAFYNRIIDVLKLYNWDTDPVPAIVKGGGIGERFLSVMHKDKKNLNDSVRLVVPKGIGEIVIEEADDKDILAVLK